MKRSLAPTMADVAARAGVSPATVSRVLNGQTYVTDATRSKVLQAMDDLQYEPNLLASALVTKQTHTLGLLLPDVSNPFFAEVVRAVEREAAALGYSVFVCNTDDHPQTEARNLQVLRQKGVDGVILSPSLEHPHAVESAVDAGYPLCFFARDVPTLAVNSVKVDDFQGGYAAAKHLLELGHERIAVVSESQRVPSVPDRLRGYRRALEEAHLDADGSVVQTQATSIETGIEAAAQLLQDGPPTGIFCSNDMLAIGVMHGLRRAGLDVPGDVSVVGFDGTLLASVVDPPLTTVVQPVQAMARAAVEAVQATLGGQREGTQRTIFQPVLRKARSTAPARSGTRP